MSLKTQKGLQDFYSEYLRSELWYAGKPYVAPYVACRPASAAARARESKRKARKQAEPANGLNRESESDEILFGTARRSWPGLGNALGLGRIDVRHGACSSPVPGYDVAVLDEEGKEVPRGELGDLAIKLPLPPGALPTLYNNDERYIEGYLTKYPGYYDTGDSGHIDAEGYVSVMGRNDDIINTAGHRLSTGGMEEILLDHPDVADAAVIGVNDELKGEVPIGFVVAVSGCTTDESILRSELVQRVRQELGPVASFKKVAVVPALPKTRSGKILRGTMRRIGNGQDYTVTPTIEDPTIFERLGPQIKALVDE